MVSHILPVGHGIGCLIARDGDGHVAVTKVIQGGAASFSGQINVGDKIMTVDGRFTKSIDPSTIGQWFLGEPGTQIVLVVRDQFQLSDRIVKLTRQPLQRVGGFGGLGSELGGIGAVLANDTLGNIVVSRLVYGGAAAYAKPGDFFGEDRLKRYDKIIAIDGRGVAGMTPAEVRPLLVGPVGSTVRLTVKRAKYEQPIEIELRRRASQMQTQFVPVEIVSERALLTVNPYNARPASATPARPVSGLAKQTPPATRTSPPVLAPADEKVGVGLVLRECADGTHAVKRLKPDQAADRCRKIDAGDLLTHVDGLDVAVGAPSTLLADLIAGPQGTVVNLTFQKADGGALSINLLRGGPEYINSVGDEDERRRSSGFSQPSPQVYRAAPPPAAASSATGDVVGLSLSLAQDYDSLVADTSRLKMWNARLKADLCTAAGTTPNRLQIVGIQRSTGVIVDVNVLPGAGRASHAIAADLAAQVADPSSVLRSSETTLSVQRADVHNGPVTPPSNAAVLATPKPPVAVAPAPPRGDPWGPAQPRPTGGDLVGVGLVLREDAAGRQIVRRLVPGQAAAASNVIMVGDVLSTVDRTPVMGENVMQLIPGPQGTQVELSFLRPDLASKDYTVVLIRGDPFYIASLQPSSPPLSHQLPPTGADLASQPPPAATPSDALLAKKRASATAAGASPFPANPPRPSTSMGSMVMVSIRGDEGNVKPLEMPGTFSQLLASAGQLLGGGEVTRVYSDSGVAITGMDEISPGQKLVMHASAKGQFESWSYGLVVKRRFVLKDRMGEVGLGQLWSARDTQMGKDVVLSEEGDETALSVRDAILSEKGRGPESDRRRYREERFLREMQIAQTFAGKHVCQVVDFGLQQGRMFVVSERLTGQTLAEALDSQAGEGAVLTEALVRKIATEILYGLSEADEAGLPHCNLTPSNIFLSSDGVRVMGLGMAGWEPDAISNADYKLPVKAAPQYMSPEQISGRIVDTRTDLFSLGVIMFRCLTGKLPFDGAVFLEIAKSIATAPTPDASHISPTSVSDHFKAVLAKAMQKDPADRYPGAQAMLDHLSA